MSTNNKIILKQLIKLSNSAKLVVETLEMCARLEGGEVAQRTLISGHRLLQLYVSYQHPVLSPYNMIPGCVCGQHKNSLPADHTNTAGIND